MTMARRGTGGGVPFPGGAHAQAGGGDSPRNLRIAFENLSVPAESVPRLKAGRPAFKRSRFSQAVIDILAVLSALVFVLVTAAAFVGAFYIVLFVRTG